ncbi:MAG: hypothetical protein KDB63_17080 [Nocardioidaceae bacterium]|nr:hypothetical protein [Nocardioidaceae bacterium]
MPRLSLPSVLLLLPLLPTAPAYAAAEHVICVDAPAGATCDETRSTIPLAISLANSNATDDLILLGAHTYSDGPYVLQPSNGHSLSLRGAGQGVTVLTAPASSAQTYLTVYSGTVSDLTIEMETTSSSGDKGVYLGQQATADRVTVDGAGTSNATAVEMSESTLRRSSLSASPTTGRGVFSAGNNTVTDTTISASQGFDLSDPGTVDVVSRVSVRSDWQGFATDGGTITIDDSVVDLGASVGSTGLFAGNDNNGTSPKTINADHVTVIGGGSGSMGVWAYAAASGATTTSSVTLTNSIVWGPETSLRVDAGNDGAQGGASTATIVTSFSDWHGVPLENVGSNGAGGVTIGAGRLDVAPGLVDAASGDAHLTAGSPVVDKGDPSASGPSKDRDGATRVADGDGKGGARRDMGAYELPDTTPPNTRLTSSLPKTTTKGRVRLSFASEAGATFTCKLDGTKWKKCRSPWKVSLSLGKHVLSVRAKDAAGNVDPTPAKVRIKRIAT